MAYQIEAILMTLINLQVISTASLLKCFLYSCVALDKISHRMVPLRQLSFLLRYVSGQTYIQPDVQTIL